MTQLVLSLFPGIGLLDMAFELEGFCVVRGPDLLWGGDIRTFHPPAGKFDGVIGGPPCQHWSRLVHLVRANGHRVAPDLIPEFERTVREARPAWWVSENVLSAPVPDGARGSAVLCDVDCGGMTSRMRRIAYGGIALTLPATSGVKAPHRAVVRDAREVPMRIGGSGKPKGFGGELPHSGRPISLGEMLRRQGFPTTLLDDAPFTAEGKRSAVGNGVPLPMGRAIAKAVKRALGIDEAVA